VNVVAATAPNRIDQAEQVERCPRCRLFGDRVQREILSAVIRQRQTGPDPDDHCGGERQTGATASGREDADSEHAERHQDQGEHREQVRGNPGV